MRDIKKAHKRLQLVWEHLMLTWPQRWPDLPAPFLTQVHRPAIVQKAYYAQGRQGLAQVNSLRRQAGLAMITQKENLKKITNAPVGTSKHEKDPAEAIDIAFLKKGSNTELNWDMANFERAWIIMKEFDPNIKWGRYFKAVDSPHFEI